MDTSLFESLAWMLAICSGLMAGTYFSFSGFIMRSFSQLNTAGGLAAMNAINKTILKSAFMPLFFGSTIVALLIASSGLWHWREPGAGLALIAGLSYLVGMFAVTALANVPLNASIVSAGGGEKEAERIWLRYCRQWTRWNTVRTLASLITLVTCLQLLNQ